MKIGTDVVILLVVSVALFGFPLWMRLFRKKPDKPPQSPPQSEPTPKSPPASEATPKK